MTFVRFIVAPAKESEIAHSTKSVCPSIQEIMKRLIFIPFIIFISGCTFGNKTRIGDTIYPAVQKEHVEVLFQPPTRPYKEIGMVSALGAQLASDTQVYSKLQSAAAELGADAVIIKSQGLKTYLSMPGHVDTFGNANTDANVQYNGFGNYSGQANTQYYQSTTVSPARDYKGLNVNGIAIKYDGDAPKTSQFLGLYRGSGEIVKDGSSTLFQIVLKVYQNGKIEFGYLPDGMDPKDAINGTGIVDDNGNATLQNQYGVTGNGTIANGVFKASGQTSDGSIRCSFTAMKQ